MGEIDDLDETTPVELTMELRFDPETRTYYFAGDGAPSAASIGEAILRVARSEIAESAEMKAINAVGLRMDAETVIERVALRAGEELAAAIDALLAARAI